MFRQNKGTHNSRCNTDLEVGPHTFSWPMKLDIEFIHAIIHHLHFVVTHHPVNTKNHKNYENYETVQTLQHFLFGHSCSQVGRIVATQNRSHQMCPGVQTHITDIQAHTEASIWMNFIDSLQTENVQKETHSILTCNLFEGIVQEKISVTYALDGKRATNSPSYLLRFFGKMPEKRNKGKMPTNT
jgi:hypothetical protein